MRTRDIVMEGVWRCSAALFAAAGLVHFLMQHRYWMVAFAASWLVSAAGWIYDYGRRTAVGLELTRTTLRKVSLLRSVEFPIGSVRGVHFGLSRSRAKKLVIDGSHPDRPVIVPLQQFAEIAPFVAVLTTAAPGVEVHVSALSALRRG